MLSVGGYCPAHTDVPLTTTGLWAGMERPRTERLGPGGRLSEVQEMRPVYRCAKCHEMSEAQRRMGIDLPAATPIREEASR